MKTAKLRGRWRASSGAPVSTRLAKASPWATRKAAATARRICSKCSGARATSARTRSPGLESPAPGGLRVLELPGRAVQVAHALRVAEQDAPLSGRERGRPLRERALDQLVARHGDARPERAGPAQQRAVERVRVGVDGGAHEPVGPAARSDGLLEPRLELADLERRLQ